MRVWLGGVASTLLWLAACASGPSATGEHPVSPAGAIPAARQPTDLAPERDGDTTTALVNGLQILVQRVTGAEIAAASIFVKGGARSWGKADAGVQRFACSVAVGAGPQGMTKASYKRRQVALGSEIVMMTSRDFSEFRAKGLASTWDDTFDLFMDVFLRPALPDAEIELKRGQLLAELEKEREHPDDHLRALGSALLFKGHPYENSPDGTAVTVRALQRKDLEAHLAKVRQTSRLVVVVVGDVDAAKIIARIQDRMGTLPRGDYTDGDLPRLMFSSPNLLAQARKLPTNHVSAFFAGPTWRDPLFAAGNIAMDLLSSRIYTEVRAKRGLSYAPYAMLIGDSYLPIGVLHVTTTDPNAAMKVMLDEVRRLRADPVSDRELQETRAVFLTRYLSLLETTDGIAGALGSAQLYTGDWRFIRKLPERMQAVTAADVQEFARRYIVNLQTAMLGDPAKLDAANLGL